MKATPAKLRHCYEAMTNEIIVSLASLLASLLTTNLCKIFSVLQVTRQRARVIVARGKLREVNEPQALVDRVVGSAAGERGIVPKVAHFG